MEKRSTLFKQDLYSIYGSYVYNLDLKEKRWWWRVLSNILRRWWDQWQYCNTMHTGCASLFSLAWEIASRISLGPEIFQRKREEYRGSNSVGHVHLAARTNTRRWQRRDESYTRRCWSFNSFIYVYSYSYFFSYTLYLSLPETCERAKLLLIGNQVMKRITDDKSNALLVVAALLVTVTYQAAITPPGGLWQDDLFGLNTRDTFFHSEYYLLKLNTTAAHIAGSAIATASELFLFFFFNSLIFVLSNVIMVVLVPPFEIIGLLLSGVCLILCLCYLSSLLLIFQAPDWTAFIVLFLPIIALMVPLAAALFFNALPFARKGIRALRNLIWND